MSNLRYVFQIGGHFRFIKLFDRIEQAISYVCDNHRPTEEQLYGAQQFDSYHQANSYGDLMYELKDLLKGKRLTKTKLIFRAIGKPKFFVDERAMEALAKIQAEKSPESFRKDSFACYDSMNVSWKTRIEVCLQYTEELDEVKVAGEPYQPPRTIDGSTEWFEVHMLQSGRQYDDSYVTISPIPRSCSPRRGYTYDPVPMSLTEYWYTASGCTIQLTTTD